MNEIAVYPHKTCIFALEKSCLTSKANLCIMQKLEPLLNHYLYRGGTLVIAHFKLLGRICRILRKNIVILQSNQNIRSMKTDLLI